jgi:hypothetical protein
MSFKCENCNEAQPNKIRPHKNIEFRDKSYKNYKYSINDKGEREVEEILSDGKEIVKEHIVCEKCYVI